MDRFLMVTLLGLSTTMAAGAGEEAVFHVAPGGNDHGAGTVVAPFATVHRARDAVRAQRAAAPDRPCRVVLAGGRYELTEPLILTPADSGTAAAPVTWTAAAGERPILSGGRALTNGRLVAGRWEFDLPEVAAGDWRFMQLFVGGERRYRPRLPRDGYFYIAKELAPTPPNAGKGADRFRYLPGDIKPAWAARGEVEVLAFNHWNMHRLPIAEVDDERQVVTLAGPTCHTSYWAALPTGYRYQVENVPEACTEPGDWYLDTAAGRLTYLPQPGEDLATTPVVAPRLRRLLELRGDATLGAFVSHVHFEGIGFEHTNWVTPPTGNSFPQAEANLGAALVADGARDCSFRDCVVQQVGEYAVELREGTRRVTLDQCVLTDLGAGGIKIGAQGIAGDQELHSGWCRVNECTISAGGRLHPAAVGVWLGHTPHNEITRNDIFDFYYTGISVGWQWGYNPSLAHHNLIADNRVWRIGQKVLSDMGGIYTLGPSEGSEIRHNWFHDIDAYSYGGWGIYFDQATTAIVARDNLVSLTKTGGFHQHFGKENVVENNIFAFARIGQLQRSRPEEHLSFFFRRNLVVWSEGPLLHGRWGDDAFVMEQNLYWPSQGQAFDCGGRSWAEWQAAGHDRDSLVADPLFVDLAAGDFRLQPDSPALKLGFVPFPLDTFGRQTAGGEWALEPRPRAWPEPGEPPVLPILEDFEDTAVGQKIPMARSYEDATVTAATVRVSDERAHSGRHSLKFTDAPGQQHIWDPHIHYSPNYIAGQVTERFALWLEPGAALTHEWRDASRPFRTGPAIAVSGDGQLTSRGRELLVLPHREWVEFVLQGGLGEQQTGRWRLTVRLPGGATEQWDDLPCDPAMRELRWLGWTSHANTAVSYFLDDIEVTIAQP